MVQISKRKLKPEVYESISNIFFDILRDRSLTNNLNELANILFSSTERVTVAKRIAILFLLKKGVVHRDIANILKVSIATIHKYARVAEDNPSSVSNILHSAIIRDSFNMFFEDVLSNVTAPGQVGTNWSAARHRKQKYEQKKRFGL